MFELIVSARTKLSPFFASRHDSGSEFRCSAWRSGLAPDLKPENPDVYARGSRLDSKALVPLRSKERLEPWNKGDDHAV